MLSYVIRIADLDSPFFRAAAVEVSSLASAQKLNSAVYQTALIPLA